MRLTPEQKSLIVRVVDAFETGSTIVDYGELNAWKNGPLHARQITYGRPLVTEYGRLRQLVRRYIDAGGVYAPALEQFADIVGSVPLTSSRTFRMLLRKAGRKDPIMREVQDALFDELYFEPAMDWARRAQLHLPLSALVVYDSFSHCGSVPWMIRGAFPERLPAEGGNERAWTRAFVQARQRWLERHHRYGVQRTVFRTQCLAEQIARGNWHLEQQPIIANEVRVSARTPRPEDAAARVASRDGAR